MDSGDAFKIIDSQAGETEQKDGSLGLQKRKGMLDLRSTAGTWNKLTQNPSRRKTLVILKKDQRMRVRLYQAESCLCWNYCCALWDVAEEQGWLESR